MNAGSPATFNAALEYPPVALTSSTTVISASNASYGLGNYLTNQSSVYPLSYAYFAFDGNPSTFWHSATTFNHVTGLYAGSASTTNANGTVHPGEWLQIRLPSAITLDSFTIWPRQDAGMCTLRTPRNFILLGSNDGSSWQTVFWEVNATNYLNSDPRRYTNIWNRNSFSYFRMSIQRVGNYDSGSGQDSVQLSLDLYGSSTGSESSVFMTTSFEYPGAVRFESFKYPGYYLRSQNNSLQFRKDLVNDIGFKNDSAFYLNDGLGGSLITLT